jgi:sialic acid synthase SpsE
MLRLLASTAKPIVLSTAMSTLPDVTAAVGHLVDTDPVYAEPGMLGLLQCRAIYDDPTSTALDLASMATLRDAVPSAVVGYSNHTVGPGATYVALGAGARIIEVHVSDDKADATYRDHRLSFDVEELRSLCALAASITSVVGDGRKVPLPVEDACRPDFRRGVYLRRRVTSGHVIGADDVAVVRPERGVPASRVDDVIGRRAVRDLEPWQPLDPSDLDGPP